MYYKKSQYVDSDLNSACSAFFGNVISSGIFIGGPQLRPSSGLVIESVNDGCCFCVLGDNHVFWKRYLCLRESAHINVV